MALSVKHPVPGDGKVHAPDYHAEHLITGTPGKFLGFDNAGNATELSGTVAVAGSPYVNVADYLAVDRIPFVTDDLPAFQAALAEIDAAGPSYGGGSRLFIPQGRYYLSGTWEINIPIIVQGAGPGTIIRFGKNCNGIELRAANCALEGVQLWGGNVNVNGSGVATSFAAGDSTTGDGVSVVNDNINVRGVQSFFFGGDGFAIIAGVEAQGNTFLLENCHAIYNRGRGYLVNGVDANAGTFNTCSAISNGGAGFLEYSFLGNTYIQCHVRDCGVSDPTGSNGPTGTCEYPDGSGNYFYMVAGQEIAASTTVPGTNTAVWRPFGGHPYCKTWVTGLEWVNPSPYGTNPANSNGRNVFLGCYAESAQAPCQANTPSLFVGGLLDEVGVVGSATWLRAGNWAGSIRADAVEARDPDGRVITLGGASNEALRFYDGANTWQLYRRVAGSFSFGLSGSGVPFEVMADGAHATAFLVSGTKVLGAQGAAVADVTGGATIDTEARAAINALLARCRAHGLIGT
jgi:hypothetical protein